MRKVRIGVRNSDLRDSTKGFASSILDEMAVPSYTHWNPVVRWLMWRRLDVVQGFCTDFDIERALDYGTGTGVMLPFLSKTAKHVVALDQLISPAERLCKRYELGNVELYEIDALPVPLSDESTDLILCLDVLEHIQQLQEVTEELARILKPGGKLVVSGPSENPVYKLGRLLAGFRQGATYHCWNIDDVNSALKACLVLTQNRKLLGPVRLFDISVFIKPSQGKD